MANRDRLLTFEEFERERNNFHLHFVGPVGKHAFGDAYRRSVPYTQCVDADRGFAKLAAELCERRDFSSPEYLEKLYGAYARMHTYAETNWEIFE